MRKRLALLSFFLFLTSIVIGQTGQLLIKGYGKDLYLEHKVSPKEGLFAIGRSYNVHPKAIAAYNRLDMAKGLTVGQIVRIPLTDTNFTQAVNKGTPIYYNVGAKETLQKVSNVNNQVSMQSLREWNKLNSDNLTAGKKLVVGFLVIGENAAMIAGEKKESSKDVADKPAATATSETDKVAVKENPSKEKENSTKEKDEPKKTSALSTKPPVTLDLMGPGYFKNDFDHQIKSTPITKSETVTSGIFKMNSKLQDVKYYLLIDGVTPGTVIKVINPENNKAIYAKVLGEMSGIRQNQGLDIRISNTAANSLGISETDKFIVKVNY